MSSEPDPVTVRWPGKAVDPAAEDIVKPTTDFLQSVELLRESDEEVTWRKTPYSLQVITAGGLALNKVSATLLGAGGVVASSLAAARAFFEGTPPVVQVALVAGAAALLIATVLGVALIVRSDVQARSEGAVAKYRARAEVTNAFLRLTGRFQDTGGEESNPSIAQMLALLATSRQLKIQLQEAAGFQSVMGVRNVGPEGIQLKVEGDWIPVDRVELFQLEISNQ